jgi:hypothetical protein
MDIPPGDLRVFTRVGIGPWWLQKTLFSQGIIVLGMVLVMCSEGI